MIDNEREVQNLIDALKQHLPIPVSATPHLVDSLRNNGIRIDRVDGIRIDSVVDVGDAGGIGCGLSLQGNAVIVSITHLRLDSSHPLYERVRAYQDQRIQKLEKQGESRTRKAPRRAATSPKRQNQKVASKSARVDGVELRLQTAQRCWLSGEFEQAAAGFRALLQPNRRDRTFARYWLASTLFQLEASDELDALLRDCDDDTGVWRYAMALQAFRVGGDSDEAQRLLVEADRLEPDFEHYLLRDKLMDASREARFDAGPAERAHEWARLFLPAWRAVPGAAAWARRVLKVPSFRDETQEARQFPLQELRALPARPETWQVGLHSNDGEEALWLMGVANVDRQEMRVLTIIDRPLSETVIWNVLLSAFLGPMEGDPARPSLLVVDRQDCHDAWEPLLKKIGIRCQHEKDPQPVYALLEAMSRRIQEQQSRPAIADLDVRELPRTDAVWQADFVRSPAWVMSEKEGEYRPWSILVIDKASGKILGIDHAPGEPTPELLLEFLLRTMAQPNIDAPQRPRVVEVCDSDAHSYLKPRLEDAGVPCRLVDHLPELSDICIQMAKRMDPPGKCAIANGSGVTQDHMESFYEAAASYFRAAPWRHVVGETPIEVQCEDPQWKSRFAIVLGRTGVQLGLCIYDDWKTTRAMLSGRGIPEENRALAVCYDEAPIMAAVDLQWIERLGWPIATKEAWPAALRLEPGHTPRSPNAKELELLDACLRAIPDFIKAKVNSQTRTVELVTRSVELHLAWVSASWR